MTVIVLPSPDERFDLILAISHKYLLKSVLEK